MSWRHTRQRSKIGEGAKPPPVCRSYAVASAETCHDCAQLLKRRTTLDNEDLPSAQQFQAIAILYDLRDVLETRQRQHELSSKICEKAKVPPVCRPYTEALAAHYTPGACQSTPPPSPFANACQIHVGNMVKPPKMWSSCHEKSQ